MKYIEFLRKIKFSNPKKSGVLVFHQSYKPNAPEPATTLQEAALYGMDYSVLPADREEFYLTPQILGYLIKNFILNFHIFLKYRSKYQIYILSCIEYIKPRIVITFIHNCFLFQTISRIYSKAEFYAVQNGIINTFTVTDMLPKPPARWGSSISMPNLICFGRYEAELHSRYGHMIDNYYPLGSLIGGYYKTKVAERCPMPELDICLVSQWRDSIMLGNENPEHKKNFGILNKYLSKYLKDRNYSLCIALARIGPEEKDYFRNIYGDRARLVDRIGMSSYAAMDRSRVVLSLYSAAALEAFGWGKKVLFCNFTGNTRHDFPVDGFWSLCMDDYEEFKNRLDYLFAIENDKYVHETKAVSKYFMNYDFSMPAHTYIRNIVLKAIK